MPATTRRPRRKARSPESAPSATSLEVDDDQQQLQQQIELLIARRDDSSEYLVKWKGASYRQLEWVKKVTLLDKFPMALQRMRHFDAKHPGSEYEFSSKPLPPTSPRKSGIHAKSDQDSLLERLVERDI
ncbi:choline dehydrogenase 7, partial [Perkinsus olseni]